MEFMLLDIVFVGFTIGGFLLLHLGVKAVDKL
jgi:hypothetical protein